MVIFNSYAMLVYQRVLATGRPSHPISPPTPTSSSFAAGLLGITCGTPCMKTSFSSGVKAKTSPLRWGKDLAMWRAKGWGKMWLAPLGKTKYENNNRNKQNTSVAQFSHWWLHYHFLTHQKYQFVGCIPSSLYTVYIISINYIPVISNCIPHTW